MTLWQRSGKSTRGLFCGPERWKKVLAGGLLCVAVTGVPGCGSSDQQTAAEDAADAQGQQNLAAGGAANVGVAPDANQPANPNPGFAPDNQNLPGANPGPFNPGGFNPADQVNPGAGNLPPQAGGVQAGQPQGNAGLAAAPGPGGGAFPPIPNGGNAAGGNPPAGNPPPGNLPGGNPAGNGAGGNAGGGDVIPPGMERDKAGVGSGKKGRGYGEGLISTPIKAYFSTQERIAFEIAIPHALQLYEATNGHKPKTHEDFMREIIEFNMIKLPDLPEGHRYVYDPEAGELMVEHPKD